MDNSNLKPFILNNGKKNPFVLVVPGGGYDHYGSREQDIIAQKMNELGFSSAVLYYRINPSTFPMPLVDLAQLWGFLPEGIYLPVSEPGGIHPCSGK